MKEDRGAKDDKGAQDERVVRGDYAPCCLGMR
jgi:hypothetical protein